MEKRCDRNRKRSKRRAIYCPIHGFHLDSMSQKYPLFAVQAGQLHQRGIGKQTSLILIRSKSAVAIEGEWLEAFWCQECFKTQWYHITRKGSNYQVRLAPSEYWQQVSGVINPDGNPSVSEFTKKQSRNTSH